MSYGRNWLDDGGSDAGSFDDCHARAFEALIDVSIACVPADLKAWALHIAGEVLEQAHNWRSLRARACLIRALAKAPESLGVERMRDLVAHLAAPIFQGFAHHRSDHHHWPEPDLSYDNARLCDALICAGMMLDESKWTEAGLISLQWLMQHQTCPKSDYFMPIPTSRFAKGGPQAPLFDQQPIEVLATIEACLSAAFVTGDRRWKNEALRAFAWFHGENSQNLSLITPDGGCFDGLTLEGCNQNQGAESILVYHLSWTALKSAL
jgi:hypothetical protein